MYSIYKERYFLGIVFFIGLVIRLCVFYGYLQHENRYQQVDSKTYHTMALSLSKGNGFVNVDNTPHVHRLPGYPAFLALVYNNTSNIPQAALLLQIILAASIPLLIFFLSLQLFPSALVTAQLSAVITMLHLGFVLYAGFFMTESLFILFFLLFLIFFCTVLKQQLNYEKQQMVYVVLSGLILGCCSLIRPVGHFLLVVSILLLVSFGRTRWYQTIKKSLIFFLSWLAVAGCWLLRNYLVTGYIFFHSLPGGHFLYLSAARVAMHQHNCTYQEARSLLRAIVLERVAALEKKYGKKLSEIEWCFVQEKLAKEYFCKAPLLTVKTWLTDILRTCFSLYSSELLYLESQRKDYDYFAKNRSAWSLFARYLFPATDNKYLKFIIYAEIIFHAWLVFFSFFSLGFLLWGFCLFKIKNYLPVAIIPFISLFICIALAGGYARMRLPVEGLLIIFAAHFFIWFFCKEKYSTLFL